MTRINLLSRSLPFAAVVMLTACGGELENQAASPDTDGGLATNRAELRYYSDTQPDPLPSAADLIQPQGTVAIFPGARACYPPLAANQSAGISGFVAGVGISKLPKQMVFWARDFRSTVSKIFAGPIQPEADGYFQTVLNRSNGYLSYFPGVFQFCVRNPGTNTGPLYVNASVVTF